MEELWIPIIAIVAPSAVVALLIWLRFRTSNETQQTIRMALDKGHELSPELIDRLGHPKPSKNRDLRFALIWLAIAFAFVLCGISVAYWSIDGMYGCFAAAAFPLSIGCAYLLIWKFAGRD
ncbi:MAG: DUF6249 domain-containing protein [Woeseiaceae bacterium]